MNNHRGFNNFKKVLIGLITLLFAVSALAQENDARNSKELSVEPEFKFSSFQPVTFDFTVYDEFDQLSSGEIVRVYAIHPEADSLQDERLADKELLFLSRTDDFGRVYLFYEISTTINQVLVEANINGYDGKAIVPVTDERIVHYQFAR